MDERTLSVQALGNSRFSASLPEGILEELAELASVREFRIGEVLFRENSQNEDLMIVVSGSVALEMNVPGRGKVRILSLGPGDMVAWSALLGGGRMTASAIALQDTQVVAIPGRDVLASCEINPTFGYHLMHQLAAALADRLVATRLQLLDLFGDSPPQTPLAPQAP